MKYPKIEIYTENKGDFEAQYICFLAKGISMGTYQDGGFLVLPNLEIGNPKTVHFPSLPYSKEFWRSINFNPNINLSTRFPDKAVAEIAGHLRKIDNSDVALRCLHLAKEWSKIEPEFFKLVDNFLNLKKTLSKVDKIKVLITPYGTRGSFNPPRVGNKFNLMLTSRTDCSVGNIASGILQNLYIIQTKIGGEIGTENYLKRMSAINFLFTNTSFSKFYPDYADLTKPDFSLSRDLVKKSDKYLTKLGFPPKGVLTKDGGKLFLNGNYVNGTFTSKETKFLTALIMASGETLLFDEVADILWGDKADDKYSLEAMAKLVEGIRRKIRETGVQKSLINTVRGKGYYLNS